ncbi:MAG: hypothetical protein ACOC33_02555 [bacterium]
MKVMHLSESEIMTLLEIILPKMDELEKKDNITVSRIYQQAHREFHILWREDLNRFSKPC